jgi:hypothetical protein
MTASLRESGKEMYFSCLGASRLGRGLACVLQFGYAPPHCCAVGVRVCVCVGVGVGASWRATRDPGPRAPFEPLISVYGASGGNSNYAKQSYWPNL